MTGLPNRTSAEPGRNVGDVTTELVELRLKKFKSFQGAKIPLGPLTLLVGRNGSGKSNVLDALAVLSSLATGADLRDALDGGRDGPVVRGGSEGCAPIGDSDFEIGCSVLIEGVRYNLDVTIATSPTLQIKSEHLWTTRRSGQRRGEPLDLLKTEVPESYSADIVARWENRKRGLNPPVTFRASQLLTSQVTARVPATSQAGREVHDIAEAMVSGLASIFILDPVPHQMREYVPEKDHRLRRSADNLSAVLRRLLLRADTRGPLVSMTRSLSEAQVSDLGLVSSELGDVMVTIDERIGHETRPVPARLMSDGTLRFLAISAALLDEPDAGLGRSSIDAPSERLLVVEELENGLHPSQAALLLNRLKSSASERNVRTLATTHSPAMLDALSGKDHKAVIVCSRREDGWTQAQQLTSFPDYFVVAGRGSLGKAAVEDRLRSRSGAEPESPSLALALGIEDSSDA